MPTRKEEGYVCWSRSRNVAVARPKTGVTSNVCRSSNGESETGDSHSTDKERRYFVRIQVFPVIQVIEVRIQHSLSD